MSTDPFIPPAQRALTGMSVNPTAGYRALQSRYEGEGANMGGGRSQQLRAYGATTEYTPASVPAFTSPTTTTTSVPAYVPPVAGPGNTPVDPFSKGTESIGTGANTNLEQAKVFGMKNFVQTGRAAGAGFGQVEVAQYPEYWRGIINYGLTPEASMKAVQNRFGYTLTDAEKRMIDPATGKPYAEAVRTIDNPNILGAEPITAAFTVGEGGVPSEGYITKRGNEKEMTNVISQQGVDFGYQSKMKLMIPSGNEGEVQFQSHYVDTETGERLEPSKFNFEQALKYGTALEGGSPSLLEMNERFRRPNPWFQQFMPGLTGLAMAGSVLTAGASAGATLAAGASGPVFTGAAPILSGFATTAGVGAGQQALTQAFSTKPQSGFRY